MANYLIWIKKIEDSIIIVVVAIIGGFVSEHFSSALDTSELYNSIVELAIITTLLLIGVSILLYAIKRGKEIEEATMIVASVLIGGFVSKYIDITSNIPLLSRFGMIIFLSVLVYSLIIVYLLLRWMNSEWVSSILKRLLNIRR